MGASQQINKPHFKTMPQTDVPQGRKGKHNKIVSAILNELDLLKDGAALKVPLSELDESMENVRSALSRAAIRCDLRRFMQMTLISSGYLVTGKKGLWALLAILWSLGFDGTGI